MLEEHYKQWNDYYKGCLLELNSIQDKLHWFNKKSSWDACTKVAHDLRDTMHDNSGLKVVDKYTLSPQCSFCDWSKHCLLLMIKDSYSNETYMYRVTKDEVYNAIRNVIQAIESSYLKKKSIIKLINKIENVKNIKQQRLNNYYVVKNNQKDYQY